MATIALPVKVSYTADVGLMFTNPTAFHPQMEMKIGSVPVTQAEIGDSLAARDVTSNNAFSWGN